MLKGSLVAAAAAAALVMAPTSALAKPDNVSATRAYIRAHYLFVRAAKAELPVEKTVAAKLVSEIRSQCPNVVTGSPRNEDAAALTTEALIVVSDTLLAPDRVAITHFVGSIENLRWSSRKLTHAVRRYAAKLRAELALKTPNLCSNLKAWAATGFQTMPASVTRTNEETEAASAGPEEIQQRLFAPYARPDDKAILRRTKVLETKLKGAALEIGLHAWSEILTIVGLGA
jgi:hypothetical protein